MLVKALKMAILGKNKGPHMLSLAMTKSRYLGQTKHEITNYLSQRMLSFFSPSS